MLKTGCILIRANNKYNLLYAKIPIMTTVEAIYENGIFKPISSVPNTLKENERVRIIIETDSDKDLQTEINQWEAASDEDLLKFEDALGENR